MLPVLQTIQLLPQDVRVVWNTNLYSSTQAIQWLGEHVDTWLIDLKFGSNACAQRLSGRSDYIDRVKQGISTLSSMSANIMVRHLLMPGHYECCTKPVLEWLAAHHPTIPVNMMTHFLPLGSPKSPLRSGNTSEETQKVKVMLRTKNRPHWMWNGQPFSRKSATTA